MACATCKYYQVVENFKMKKYSHYCFFFSTFMEKTKGRCESKRPIKASEPQDVEQKGGDG